MTLEDLIYSRLSRDADLAGMLAVFHSSPAVFYQTAPDDTAEGWARRKQYPRINYTVDYASNPERKTCGVLSLDISSSEDDTPPEELEPLVRRILCGVFLTPEELPYSLAWTRSDSYDQTREDDGVVVGITVLFDVYAFPPQITTDPDPVLAMNHWCESAVPGAEIIGGRKPAAEVFVPSPERPALYFRLETVQTQRITNTVAWMDATIACHVFAGGEETTWLKYLAGELAAAGEVIMLDSSPMFLNNLRVDNTLDALSTGQMRLGVRYGVLRRPGYAHPLMRPWGNGELLANPYTNQ